LGTALLGRLLQIGRQEKIRRIFGLILPENLAMRRICEKLGFHLALDIEDLVVEAAIELPESYVGQALA
jgi:acetyltransferase